MVTLSLLKLYILGKVIMVVLGTKTSVFKSGFTKNGTGTPVVDRVIIKVVELDTPPTNSFPMTLIV